ncbi:hypothetical protein BTA30_20340 [Bacillus swezeyi]|uniref:Uncharacterized protein n=1 Tax=Bacillus swezeyi TaxID=1925020 RepID=A0A1R1RIN8_9BACI|nr:hypothetical protein BW143_00570 [Bacillus swezeyi]OMI25876.1 hypothetical protein BTA30_20340 [Bacillus swezeyi]
MFHLSSFDLIKRLVHYKTGFIIRFLPREEKSAAPVCPSCVVPAFYPHAVQKAHFLLIKNSLQNPLCIENEKCVENAIKKADDYKKMNRVFLND